MVVKNIGLFQTLIASFVLTQTIANIILLVYTIERTKKIKSHYASSGYNLDLMLLAI